jgi:2-isopropylmalate synthase
MSASTKEKVLIYDTTLRDGTQAEGVSLSLEDKLLIAESLDGLGVDYIEGGYPLSNPKDKAFFEKIRKRKIKHSRVAAFGMTRRRGLAVEKDEGMLALLASEAPVVTIVGKTWDFHVSEVLRVSLEDNLEMVADSVGLFVREGREAVYDAEHFFDGFKANRAYAIKTLVAAFEAGATTLCLCDTNGGSLPAFITEAIGAVRMALPDARLGIHCHNDSSLAVANSLAAVAAGATHVQGTVNGIGERCGNADLTSIIPNLVLKCGRQCLTPETLKKLTEVSRYVYEVANLNFRDNQPFVGSAAFAHKGGMHVHAVQRNTATYEHIDPTCVGNSRRILVSELSGVSNIAATAGAKFDIAGDKEAQRKILNTMTEMENQGYQFEAAEASFEVLVRKVLGGQWYRHLWDLVHYSCSIFKQNHGTPNTEAVVKIVVKGKTQLTVAEGDGPVDSLHKAVCAALRKSHPVVDDLHLVDYKVRVVNTAAETAAKVRVVIDWHDSKGAAYFGSVGVSTNIIDASWLAIVDAIEFKLLQETEA